MKIDGLTSMGLLTKNSSMVRLDGMLIYSLSPLMVSKFLGSNMSCLLTRSLVLEDLETLGESAFTPNRILTSLLCLLYRVWHELIGVFLFSFSPESEEIHDAGLVIFGDRQGRLRPSASLERQRRFYPRWAAGT